MDEEVRVVVDVGRADKVGLVPTRLKRVLGHVRVVDRLKVERSGLADRLENGRALFGLDLLVGVVLDDKA